MPTYFVHRYDVVRVKVAVEAEGYSEAMKAADAYLAEHHPIQNAYNADWADTAKPTWIHVEEAGQEVQGYLVDLLDDDTHEHSREFGPDFQPINESAAQASASDD